MVADLLKYRHGVEVSRRHLPEAPGGLWRLSEDSAGNVWICTERRGVIQVPPEGTPRRWTSTNGLASSNARFVFEDREKTLWVGTSGGGLSRFSERRFQGHGSENGLPEPVVDSVWPAGGRRPVDWNAGEGLVPPSRRGHHQRAASCHGSSPLCAKRDDGPRGPNLGGNKPGSVDLGCRRLPEGAPGSISW